jgi:hypothetical protein
VSAPPGRFAVNGSARVAYPEGIAASSKQTALLVFLAALLAVGGYFIVGLGTLPCTAENSSIASKSPQGQACDLVTGADSDGVFAPLLVLGLLVMFMVSFVLLAQWRKGNVGSRSVAIGLVLQLVIPVAFLIAFYLPPNTP